MIRIYSNSYGTSLAEMETRHHVQYGVADTTEAAPFLFTASFLNESLAGRLSDTSFAITSMVMAWTIAAKICDLWMRLAMVKT